MHIRERPGVIFALSELLIAQRLVGQGHRDLVPWFAQVGPKTLVLPKKINVE